jgi:bidirectional [NiFe] hydrogenase diaphorase subunit
MSQTASLPLIPAPSDDKRWHAVDATMRLHGYKPSALIETLNTVQSCFGYLAEASLIYVARSLKVPLSKAFGVATFYSVFLLKPQGEHVCIVCSGTACYIKGAPKLLAAVERCAAIRASETTPDNKLSLAAARCFGACGIAPAAIFDGQVVGDLTPEETEKRIRTWLERR